MNLLPVLHRPQRQQADCLAACVAMVLDYLHIPVRYSEILKLLQVRSYGTSFSNLRHLQSLGLFVLIEDGYIERLQAHLDIGLPPIVAVSTARLAYWQQEDTDHALVVIGIDEVFVYVLDPEFTTTPQIIPIKEFESAWLDQEYQYGVIGLDKI